MVKSKVHYTENHGKLKIEYKEANSRGKKTFCLMSQSFDKDCYKDQVLWIRAL